MTKAAVCLLPTNPVVEVDGKWLTKDWLKQLDPLSTKGLWFERFAEGYPTKDEAAINYLQES